MHSGGITMGLCKPSTLSPPNYSTTLTPSSPSPFFFLPSLPNFHSSLSLSVFSYPVRAPFTKSLLKPGEKGSAAAAGHSFLQGRYRGAGSSLHERAPFLQLHSAPLLPPLFTEALLCQEQGSTEKKEGSLLFSLCTPHSYTSVPKAPANELASAVL